MNSHGLGSLSMYYVFQYYPAIRGLSLNIYESRSPRLQTNYAKPCKREPAARGGISIQQYKNENVKREAGQNSWLTPLCSSGDGGSLFCEPLWVTGSEITSFKAFLISSVLPQFQLSAECLSVRNWSALHHAHNHIWSQRWLGLFYKNPVVFIFSRSLEETTENLICYFFFQVVKVRVRIRKNKIKLACVRGVLK